MGVYEFKKEDAVKFAAMMHTLARPHGDELQFERCPACQSRKDKWTFSINLKTGACNCLRASCSYKGNMVTLARDFNFELDKNTMIYHNINNYNSRYKSFKPGKRESTDRAVEYLKGRGISEKVCRKYEITTKTDDDGTLVFPFKDENGILTFIKYRNMDFVKGESMGAKEWCEPNCKPILFGMAQVDPECRQLIFTEGQIDSLSVAEAGFKNAVSVPTGKNGFTWIGACWDWLMTQGFDEFVIFGDKEGDTMTLLDDINRRFTDKTIKHVRLEDYKDCKDANEILQKYGVQQIRKCIENAEVSPIKGLIDLSEVAPLNRFEIEKLPTGLKKVDTMLCGGLPFGGVTDITGKTGEGKSTLASQLIANACELGYKCMVYSGELDVKLFKEGLDRQVAGECVTAKSEEGGWTSYHISASDQSQINAFYRNKVFFYDAFSLSIETSDDEPKTLCDKIQQAALRYNIRVFLIDNLMTAMDLEPSENYDKYEKQSRFMKRLVGLAIKYNVLIILVAHNRKDISGSSNDNISGTADIGNLATVTIDYTKAVIKTDKSGESKKHPKDCEGVELRSDQRLLRIGKNRLFAKICLDGWATEYDLKSNRIYMTRAEKERKYPFKDFSPKFEDAEPDEIPF